MCVDSVADQLEPQICTQQLNTSRLFRDGAAEASASNQLQLSVGFTAPLYGSQSFNQATTDQAAAASAQSLAVHPALGLAAPSTGWLSDSVKIGERVLSLLNACGALQVSKDLQALGYPEVVCQRACLELRLMGKPVDADACVYWIKQQPGISSLNRCGQ